MSLSLSSSSSLYSAAESSSSDGNLFTDSSDGAEDSSDDSESIESHSDVDLIEDSDSCSELSDSWSEKESTESRTSLPTHRPHPLLSRFDPSFEKPLYEGGEISILDSYLLLLQYSLRHSLTKKSFSELIELVSVHLPKEANCAESLHKLKSKFSGLFDDMKTVSHHYCLKCHIPIDDCGPVCSCLSATGVFLVVPIAPQLRRIIEDPRLWNLLKKRFESRTSGVIKDVYDGELYQQNKHLLGKDHPANVSLLLNTDGVALFKSSKVSLWPVWVVINELPPAERFSKRNMMLVGLWHDKEKPTMTTFLKPVVENLNKLSCKGVEVKTPEGTMTCKAYLLMCSVDLPAQAVVVNMKQFNGAFGCVYCEAGGVPRPNAPMVRNWPKTAAPLRTHGSIIANGREAVEKRTSVKGIKGPSALMLHKYFDISKGFGIDSLHVIFLGVTSDMLTYWFEQKHRGKGYNIRSKLADCDRRLLSIKVPDVITRTPKSISDFNRWKELRSWLLYYSLPVLFGILPQPFFNHYSLLVSAVHTLLSDKITSTDLDNAEKCLATFYERMPDLYGDNSTTMKVHLLSHTAMCVKHWGPLWSYSCFTFEGQNHVIRSLFHGTRQMSKQLAFSHTMMQLIPVVIRIHNDQTTDRASLLLEKFTDQKRVSSLSMSCGQTILGQVSLSVLPSAGGYLQINHALSLMMNDPPVLEHGEVVEKCLRVAVKSVTYYSSDYTRVKVRNSYTVQFLCEGQIKFGVVMYYVHIPKISIIFAAVSELKPVSSPSDFFNLPTKCMDALPSSGVLPVSTSSDSQLLFVPVNQLIRKAVLIKFENKQYVCTFPNNLRDD